MVGKSRLRPVKIGSRGNVCWGGRETKKNQYRKGKLGGNSACADGTALGDKEKNEEKHSRKRKNFNRRKPLATLENR